MMLDQVEQGFSHHEKPDKADEVYAYAGHAKNRQNFVGVLDIFMPLWKLMYLTVFVQSQSLLEAS